MKNLFCMADPAQGGDSWILLLVMGAFLVLIILTSIIPQKKRQKEMMNMLNNIKVGDEIKTIGGMVGIITEMEESGLLVINVGTENAPTFIKIDRVAIYSIKKQEEVPAVQEVVEAPAVEETEVKEDAENK